MPIAWVMRFKNGMVAVFDERGEQMPKYQGYWADVKDRILRDKPPTVAIERQAGMPEDA